MRGRGERMWSAVGMWGALSVVAGAGCLSEGRHTVEDTSDTTTDTGGDADTRDTSVDADTVDRCLGKTCDDQDECTFDRCVPETGECEHLGLPSAGDPAMPAPTECTSNLSCEDGDPCTTNTCVTWPSGCGNVGGSYCVTELIPGCGGCQGGCDDGNPCTVDSCGGNGCLFAPIADCMPECVDAGTATIAEAARSGQPGADVKVAGEVFAHPLFQACNDGPQCGCLAAPGLRDGPNAPEMLMLRGTYTAPSGEELRWGCTLTGCGQPVVNCEPVKWTARYRAWGVGLASWELGDGAGQAAVPVPVGLAGVRVEDFCIETKRDSLVGAYAGTLSIGGYLIDFEAALLVENGGLWAKLGGGACRDCPGSLVLETATVPVTVGDGWVQLEVTLPGFLGPKLETVRLYSNRNQLAGNYGQGGPSGAVAVPQGGHMALVRRPQR